MPQEVENVKRVETIEFLRNLKRVKRVTQLFLKINFSLFNFLLLLTKDKSFSYFLYLLYVFSS